MIWFEHFIHPPIPLNRLSLSLHQKWKSILCDKESPESGKWKKINKYIQKTFAKTQAFVIFPVMRKYWYNFFPKFTELNVVVPQRGTNIAVRNQQKCLCLGWHNLKKGDNFLTQITVFWALPDPSNAASRKRLKINSVVYHCQNYKEPFRTDSL